MQLNIEEFFDNHKLYHMYVSIIPTYVRTCPSYVTVLSDPGLNYEY